jgi:hypothetical protein
VVLFFCATVGALKNLRWTARSTSAIAADMVCTFFLFTARYCTAPFMILSCAWLNLTVSLFSSLLLSALSGLVSTSPAPRSCSQQSSSWRPPRACRIRPS